MFGATMNAARRTATTAFQNPTVRRGLQIAGAGMSGYNAVKGVHDINKSRIGFMDALNMPNSACTSYLLSLSRTTSSSFCQKSKKLNH